MVIARVERIELRDVWKQEAYDFTPWLQDNIEILNEVLDLGLGSAEREQPIGSFSVDLVAEDESGGTVVIENQLARSDHDHLGKLITYAVALDAKTAIWIVADPRPEHIGAVNWLNESSAVGFYLVKLEAIRIGESEPAPLLTLITGPSEEARKAGETKERMAERDRIRHEFWTELLERAQERTSLFAGISPSRGNWVGTSAGHAGLAFDYVARQHDGQVELYIDRGREASEENTRIFDALMTHKEEIEERFGEALDWQRLEGRQACRIRSMVKAGGYLDRERWPEIQDAMIERMCRFVEVLQPYVMQLRL
ncbi:MAG: DUF4268 domain-containing protein [Anaerolineae bacterium]